MSGHGQRSRRAARVSVGMLTYSTLPRGSVVHAAAVTEALVEAGCDVTLYALDKDGRGFFRPLRAPLRLIPAAPAPTAGTASVADAQAGATAALVAQRAAELVAFLTRLRPRHAVLHAQDCLTSQAILSLRAAGLPVSFVRTLHHVEDFEDPTLAACQRRSVEEADICLTVSRTTQEECWDAFGVRAHLVGNGVDSERFAAAATVAATRRRANAAASDPVTPSATDGETQIRPARTRGATWLVVGGVEERKNTRVILQAFAEAHAQGEAARLLILGGATVLDHGRYRAAYESDKAALPAATRSAVEELGVVPHGLVADVFAQADVLMMPSLQEGFGLATLEALAAGLPVVASRRRPFTEYLSDKTAVLVDPSSPAAVAAGARAALDITAREERVRWGQRLAARYDWRQVAARHMAHYHALPTRHAREDHAHA